MSWIPNRWRRRRDAAPGALSRALLEHFPGIALVVDRQGIVLEASVGSEARVGRRCHELDEDPLGGALVRGLAGCVAAGGDWQGEVRCRIGGERRYQLAHIRALPAGAAPRWLVTLCDVDHLVGPARDEHARLRLLEATLGRLPGAVFRLRQTPRGDWRFDYLSAGVEALCGLSPETLSAEPRRWLQRVAAEDREAVEGELARSAIGLTPWHQSFRLSLSDGERWLEARAEARRVAEGETVWEGWWLDATERKRVESRTEALVSTDMLTGVLNRRGFRANGRAVLARAERHHRPVVVAMLDLDHFKALNDTYGHAAGDITLQTFAHICRDCLRPYDLIGRIGGEEFAVMLSDGDPDEAQGIFERLRETVADTELVLGEECLHVTVSLGLALVPPGGDLDEALNRADLALYRAKQAGRNRVVGP
ncbi:GGDEF domain-containing protein [Halomonas getboli]|uniref:GGDEF domain-containing protein n=1 Tax=Halomonas getboli TaxID=2935862 RepID=UPI001FFF86F7|nr:diguanylate cyclase [Halomonas getboli]MCK2184265.1 sensor domain-containing diguanylate cyclase [Halomonas getboli]